MPEVAIAVRELTLGEAIREALAEEMRRDSRVFILGEDIAEAGHPFKVLTGLVTSSVPNECSTRRSRKPASRRSRSAQR